MHDLNKYGKVSHNFKRHEFACSCCGASVVDPELVNVLQDIRDTFGAPITITSGYRCEPHNESVGGTPNSTHKQGIAADIQVRGVAPEVIAEFLDDCYQDSYGIGGYATFTHIDVRKNKARW